MRDNQMCLPKPDVDNELATYSGLYWFTFDLNALKHKEYPTCSCGQKYVRIKKNDSKCLKCKKIHE